MIDASLLSCVSCHQSYGIGLFFNYLVPFLDTSLLYLHYYLYTA